MGATDKCFEMHLWPLGISSSDTSSDEKSADGIGARRLEEDPSKVDFLKTGTKIVLMGFLSCTIAPVPVSRSS